jgi:hypothetical protein
MRHVLLLIERQKVSQAESVTSVIFNGHLRFDKNRLTLTKEKIIVRWDSELMGRFR